MGVVIVIAVVCAALSFAPVLGAATTLGRLVAAAFGVLGLLIAIATAAMAMPLFDPAHQADMTDFVYLAPQVLVAIPYALVMVVAAGVLALTKRSRMTKRRRRTSVRSL